MEIKLATMHDRGAGGLSFAVSDKACPNITVDNITAAYNGGPHGGGHLSIYWNTLTNPSIAVTISYFVDGVAQYGGGVKVHFHIQHMSGHTFTEYRQLTFVNCTFQSNSAVFGGAAAVLFSKESIDQPPQVKYMYMHDIISRLCIHLDIRNCTGTANISRTPSHSFTPCLQNNIKQLYIFQVSTRRHNYFWLC